MMKSVAGKGYKETEVGVIPQDWECEELRNYFSFISYGFTNPMPTALDGIFMITANDINEGRIKYETARKTTDEAFNNLLTDKSRPRRNDILLTKDGTLGRLALVGDAKICINQSVSVIRPNNRVNPTFLKKMLEGSYYQKTMIENAGGSTIKHIYITVVDKMKVALPTNKLEQTAIANALSDTDALIASLEKLIDKKRKIKRGAMQELLTGKKRLPGSEEKWEVKKLGEIASIYRGASPRPIDNPIWFDEESEIGWVRISDVTNTYKYLTVTTQRLSSRGIESSRRVNAGNLIMSICATVGRPIITKKDVCIHDGFVVFDNLQADKEFMFYYLMNIESSWSKSGQTGSQMNLNTNIIQERRVNIPPREEQESIAQVFSLMDAEIEQLEQKLAKYRMMKQGMMQELLTGRVRLV